MARIALCDASGPLTDLLQKLSGENGDAYLSTLNKMLRGELTENGQHPTPITKREFAVWKTITLGTHKDVKSLKKQVEKDGFKVSDWAADIMGKPAFTLATEETSVDLVNVSVGELGFTKATPLRDIYARAIDLGLQLCPAEVGPQLRRQYANQPNGEWLRVAMEAITGSGGSLRIFGVVHVGAGQWLGTSWGPPDGTWYPGLRFVFRK
jgi:hypothetical protein